MRAAQLGSAIRLSYLTIAWNLVGGTIAFTAAIVGGSLALGGFGLNMLIDTAASVVLVWRFKHEGRNPDAAHRVERRAQVAIAAAMLVVALYLTIQAIHALVHGARPETSILAVALTVASVLVLPWLARAKLRVAGQLGSRALRGDAVLTAASAVLGALTLTALLLNRELGWWWADAAAAVVIAAALATEASRAAAEIRSA